MNIEHKEYDGRKVRIPNPRPGWINPFAGRVGIVAWAGWEDWYTIHVDGQYLVRVQAHEITPNLLPE
jgi:hypothetical protein